MTTETLPMTPGTANTDSGQTVLEVENLKQHFPIKAGVFQRKVGELKAVDGIDLQVAKGEVLGLVGESGCGKSTAARSIVRLYKPTDGTIRYKGRDITGAPERHLRKGVRKEIQLIFQDPYASLNPRKTVKSALTEPLREHRLYDSPSQRLDRAKEMLDTVGLKPSFIGRYPHEFSGGQRQRIGIARSLVLNPELIIADEAVSALDVSIQAQIINLMQKLQADLGLTYMFIAHDLSVVRQISDRVGVMYLGHLMEVANKADLFDNPLHPYTKSLLSAVPAMNPRHSGKRERIILQGDVPSPANPPRGCVFQTRCPKVMDICREVRPTLKNQTSKQSVACHLY